MKGSKRDLGEQHGHTAASRVRTGDVQRQTQCVNPGKGREFAGTLHGEWGGALGSLTSSITQVGNKTHTWECDTLVQVFMVGYAVRIRDNFPLLSESSSRTRGFPLKAEHKTTLSLCSNVNVQAVK